MKLRDAPATAGLSGLTLLVSGVVLAAGKLTWSAIAGGFIPLRMAGIALPADFGPAVPAWLTPLSATLLHGGLAHLALNLVMLAYCGMAVERALGAGATVLLYGVGAYAAAAGQWAFGPESTAPMIGASGAISAIVAAYALLYGERRAPSIAGIPAGFVHALWLGVAWIGIQLLVGIAGLGGMAIAIGAHIGGFIAGLVLTRPLLAWRYRSA